MTPQLLSAHNLKVSYNISAGKCEVDGVTVAFPPGELTAIVGPNGSGKSTLIRALSRVLEPTEGTVLLDGKNLYRQVTPQESAMSISVTPQDTHVAFEFTTRELVAMGRTPYHAGWAVFSGESPIDRQAVDRALAAADISPVLAERPVMALSGGERQRALIARSLVQDAKNILLDEPTSSLDIGHQTALFGQLRQLATEEHKSVIFALHDLNQAAAYADRLVVLNNGKIVADGTVSSVLSTSLIWDVYHCSVRIGVDLATGRSVISPIADRSRSCRLRGAQFYVICGGGGGSELLRLLSAAGAQLHAGFLDKADIDHTVASLLEIPCDSLEPFQTVPDQSEAELLTIASKFDGVIFVPGGLGRQNMASLRTARRLAEAGMRIVTLNSVERSALRSQAEISEIEREWTILRGLLLMPPLSGASQLIEALAGVTYA
jgi:ABC-type cobalamin/Fe3+-siderophores transport system ATPase subunit